MLFDSYEQEVSIARRNLLADSLFSSRGSAH